MNTPNCGVSLFQGAESIKVNNSLEREEEAEAIEDQRRRNEELGNILQNAFDDLDDEDTTVDSTTNFQSGLLTEHNEEQSNHNNGEHPHALCEAEIHQLKMMIESRSNELQNTHQMVNNEYKQRIELQKRLGLAEAELDRAHASKKNTYELLVESKEKCSNLENIISKMKTDKKELEAENNTLLGKLETAQTLLADVQRKYDMVEKDVYKQNDRNAEMRRKQMEERHRAEIEILQQQMEQLDNKLERKTIEVENINTRYHALQSSHEKMLVDKTANINDLSNALTESQKKCEELLSRQDYFQENIRLQKLVARLQQQIQDMEKTIASLNERLEFTTAELDVMDSVLHQHNMEETPRRLSQAQDKVIGSTPWNTKERVGNLREELYRALTSLKTKREEIRRLNQSLGEKTKEIETLQQVENTSLVQITTLKEDKSRLENRLKLLEEEYSSKIKYELEDLVNEKSQLENRCKTQEAERKRLDAQLKNVEVDLEELKQEHEGMKANYEHILEENHKLRNRQTADNIRLELKKNKFLLKDAQAECDRLKSLYVEISNEKEAICFEMEKLRNSDSEKELQDMREKVANLQRALQLNEIKSIELAKILETEKLCHEQNIKEMRERMEKIQSSNDLKTNKDAVNNCTKCLDYIAQITKFEIQNLKLSNTNSKSKHEIDTLTHNLKSCMDLNTELTEKLKLSEQQEVLIKELKVKAHKFEEYIKSQNNSSEDKSCNTDNYTSPKSSAIIQNKGVLTSPTLEKIELRRLESRIRTDMSKIFANELKRFQLKLQQTEEQTQCLQIEYQHVSKELQQRQTEVDLLKQAILAEREKVSELLKQKESETNEIVQKQNAILLKCSAELKAKNQKITEISKELVGRQAQIEAERQSMKRVMSQWETQRKNIESVESEWKEKFDEIKRTHDATMVSWQSKYNSAKRTAANYKRYAEDKEAHMLKEYERIKFEYDASLSKIELRMQEALERKNRDLWEAKLQKENQRDKENKAKNNQ